MDKIRKRYALFRVRSDHNVAPTRSALEVALHMLNSQADGRKKSSDRTTILMYDPRRLLGIVRLPHTQLAELRKQVSSTNKEIDRPFDIEIVLVSGTIKKLKAKLLSHDSVSLAQVNSKI